MLYKLTGFYELRDGPPLIREISLSQLIDHSMLEDNSVSWHLRHALYMHVMYSQPVETLDQYASSIVRLALGRYGPDTSSILIDEQLVFLSLFHWLRQSPEHAPYGLFCAAKAGSLCDSGLRCTGFFENLAMILWNAHVRQVEMSSILEFVTSSPAWVNARFEISLPQLASHAFSAPPRRYQPSQLIASAETTEDVRAWFDTASCPFLLPGPSCGVELLCIVQLDADHRLLLCFETQRQVLSSLRPRTRVTPTHPSDFYAQDPAARERWKRHWAQIMHSLPSARPNCRSKLSVVHVLCYTQPQSARVSPSTQVAILSHGYLNYRSNIDIGLRDLVNQ